jgi:hypothetical protein
MPLIIDTYNVLHTVGVLPPDLAGIEVPGLIGLIKRSRYRAEKTTLVCDGKPDGQGAPREPSILVRYSGPGKPADDLIGQLVRASTAPRRLTVVSSDHAVQRTARKRRCRVLTSEEFLGQLAEDADLPALAPTNPAKPPPGQMTPEQIDRWVKVFDIDEKLTEIESRAPVESSAPAANSLDEDATQSEDFVPEIPPGPVLPQGLIEQAEQLWKQGQQRETLE